MAKEITSTEQFDRIVSSSPLVIVKFYFTWCHFCKEIASDFNKLGKAVSCVSVNIDKHPEIAGLFQVSSGPTFVILKHGRVVAKLAGGDMTKLKKEILKAAK